MKVKALLILTVLFLNSCKPDPPLPPVGAEVQEIQVSIDHLMNGTTFNFIDDFFELPDSSIVNSTRIAYILSEFYLKDEQGNKIDIGQQYAYLNPKVEKNHFTIVDIPKGHYSAIGFSLGLDSATNHGNPDQYPVTHPLSPINNSLHWNWLGGYVFIALEGRFEGNNEGYIFHIAGSENMVAYEFPLEFDKSNKAMHLQIQFDLEEMFQNPEHYSMTVDGNATHGISDPAIKKLVKNLSTVFTVIDIHE